MPTETDAAEWEIGEPRWDAEGLAIVFEAYRAGVDVRFRIAVKVFDHRYRTGSKSERKAALLKHSEAIKAGAARKLERLRTPLAEEITRHLDERDW